MHYYDLIDNDVLTQDPLKESDILNNNPEKSLPIAINQNYCVIKIELKYHKSANVNSGINSIIEKHTKKKIWFLP